MTNTTKINEIKNVQLNVQHQFPISSMYEII
jgi:hypothetical protein